MLSEKLKRKRNSKITKKESLCSVGDYVQCICYGAKRKVLNGIVVKKQKRTKRFFDYVYYVATEEGVFKTPQIVINKILSKI